MTKNGCLFACEFLKQPSVFSFEQIVRAGGADVWMSGGLGSADLPDSRQASLRSMQRPPGPTDPPGPPSITGVYLVSLVISLCVEKTISYDKKSRRHDNTFKTIQKRLKWFEYISNDLKLYFNNIGLHSGHSRFGQRLRQGREKEMLREQRELEGENRITTIDSCKQLSTAERKHVTVYIYIYIR